ncbi:hypothetical protein ACFLU6_12405 [Acidobacteriota bacterium]
MVRSRLKPGKGKRRALWLGGGLLICLLLAGGLRSDARRPTADWRVGKVQYVDRGDEGIGIYMSLRNHGEPSRERVLVFVLAGKVVTPSKKDKPVLDLSRATRNRRTAVVETTFTLPVEIAKHSPGSYHIVLTVDGITTDFILIKDGDAILNTPQRKEFHK